MEASNMSTVEEHYNNLILNPAEFTTLHKEHNCKLDDLVKRWFKNVLIQGRKTIRSKALQSHDGKLLESDSFSTGNRNEIKNQLYVSHNDEITNLNRTFIFNKDLNRSALVGFNDVRFRHFSTVTSSQTNKPTFSLFHPESKIKEKTGVENISKTKINNKNVQRKTKKKFCKLLINDLKKTRSLNINLHPLMEDFLIRTIDKLGTYLTKEAKRNRKEKRKTKKSETERGEGGLLEKLSVLQTMLNENKNKGGNVANDYLKKSDIFDTRKISEGPALKLKTNETSQLIKCDSHMSVEAVSVDDEQLIITRERRKSMKHEYTSVSELVSIKELSPGHANNDDVIKGDKVLFAFPRASVSTRKLQGRLLSDDGHSEAFKSNKILDSSVDKNFTIECAANVKEPVKYSDINNVIKAITNSYEVTRLTKTRIEEKRNEFGDVESLDKVDYCKGRTSGQICRERPKNKASQNNYNHCNMEMSLTDESYQDLNDEWKQKKSLLVYVSPENQVCSDYSVDTNKTSLMPNKSEKFPSNINIKKSEMIRNLAANYMYPLIKYTNQEFPEKVKKYGISSKVKIKTDKGNRLFFNKLRFSSRNKDGFCNRNCKLLAGSCSSHGIENEIVVDVDDDVADLSYGEGDQHSRLPWNYGMRLDKEIINSQTENHQCKRVQLENFRKTLVESVVSDKDSVLTGVVCNKHDFARAHLNGTVGQEECKVDTLNKCVNHPNIIHLKNFKKPPENFISVDDKQNKSFFRSHSEFSPSYAMMNQSIDLSSDQCLNLTNRKQQQMKMEKRAENQPNCFHCFNYTNNKETHSMNESSSTLQKKRGIQCVCSSIVDCRSGCSNGDEGFSVKDSKKKTTERNVCSSAKEEQYHLTSATENVLSEKRASKPERNFKVGQCMCTNVKSILLQNTEGYNESGYKIDCVNGSKDVLGTTNKASCTNSVQTFNMDSHTIATKCNSINITNHKKTLDNLLKSLNSCKQRNPSLAQNQKNYLAINKEDSGYTTEEQLHVNAVCCNWKCNHNESHSCIYKQYITNVLPVKSINRKNKFETYKDVEEIPVSLKEHHLKTSFQTGNNKGEEMEKNEVKYSLYI